MMTDPCVLGIDFGTESVRVGIFTPDGSPIIFCRNSFCPVLLSLIPSIREILKKASVFY